MNDELVAREPLRNEPVVRARPVEETVRDGRSKTELLKDYRIEIRFLSRGCIVAVGCKEIAFEKVDKAMAAIQAYIKDPHTEGQKWRAKFQE